MANSNMQFGGWYANPAAGGQVQRYWDNFGWTSGADPTGGKGDVAPDSSSSSSSSGGGSGDYYSQALQAIQPQIDAAQKQIQASTDQQVQPFQDYLAKLPDVYAQKQTALQHQSDTTQQLAEAQKKSNLDVAQQTTQQLSGQAAATQGQQRAEAASRGIGTTSGVERSAESSTAAGLARSLADLDTNTQNTNTQLGIKESGDMQAIADQIAAIPNEQAQEAMQYGVQIAKIRGEGAQSALSYTAQLMQMAATQAYQQAQLALSSGNQQLAYEKLQETERHNQAIESIRSIGIGTDSSIIQALLGNNNQGNNAGGDTGVDPNTGLPADFTPIDDGSGGGGGVSVSNPINADQPSGYGGYNFYNPVSVGGSSGSSAPISSGLAGNLNFGALPGLNTSGNMGG